MPFDCIVADTKNTGTSTDDTFYLVVDGATIPLYRTNFIIENGAPVITFQSREYSFWHIRYFPNSDTPENEYWQVVKDNGERHTFGLHGIQWGVCWDNWIGATTDLTGQRFPVAWNLVKIESPWNECVSFTYNNENIQIGSNQDAFYTRASRVETITDSLGRTITLHYQLKELFEIQLPHIAPAEDNAYQFKYEEKYLTHIDVCNEQRQHLFTTTFNYDFLNVSQQPENDNFKKRYLTAIHQLNANNAALPPMTFSYWDDAHAANPGAIKSITRPYGGVVSYEYALQELASSSTCTVLRSPGQDYTPMTWSGSDYTVVAWYNAGRNHALLSAYSWGGTWKGWQSDTISNLNIDDFNVRVGRDFFVVWFKDLNLRRYRVMMFKQSAHRFGEWETTEALLDHDFTQISLCVGDNFVAMQAPRSTQLRVQQWDGLSRRWVENLINTERYDKVALCGINNICLAAYYDTPRQSLTIRSFYGDQQRLWQPADQQQFNVTIDWSITTESSFWSIAPDYAIATYIKEVSGDVAKYDFMMVQWRKNYQFLPANVFSYEQDKALGNPVGYSVSTETVFGNGAHIFRFSGQTWNANMALTPAAGSDYRYAYGADLTIAVAKTGNTEFISSRVFDPYLRQWSDGPIAFSGGATDVPEAPSISGSVCIVKNRVYGKDANNDWQLIHSLPDAVDTVTIQNRSPFYIAYQLRNDNSTWVLFLADGAIVGEPTMLLNEKIYVPNGSAFTNLAGGEAFITYKSETFARADELLLHRVINQSVTDLQVSRSVSRAVVDTGFQSVASLYQYDLETATYDPRGLVAQFVRAKTYRNDLQGKDGYTESIFFNGLNPDVPGVDYPDTDDFTNVKTFFSLFNGRIYQALSYDGDGLPVAKTTHYLYAWDQTPEGENIYGVYIRLRKKVETAWLAAFTLPGFQASALDAGTLSADIRDAFTQFGFPLTADAVLSTTAVGRFWRVDDIDRHFTLVLDNGDIQVRYAVDSVVESDYNGMGQIASSITRAYDASGHEEVKVKTTRYAWEFYPPIKALNLLQPWALKQTFNQSADKITALSVNTFKNNWETSQVWASHKEYVWQGVAGTEQFDFENESGGNEPPVGWLNVSQIQGMTENGLPTETVDLEGIQKRIIYDKNNRFPVAVFSMPQHQQGISGYCGFERYETFSPWEMSDHSPLESHLGDDDSYTGERSLRLNSSGVNVGLAASFSQQSSCDGWIISGWMKTDSKGAVPAALTVKLTGHAEKTVGERSYTLPSEGDRWQYFHLPVHGGDLIVGRLTALEILLTCPTAGVTLLIDNIAIAPLQGAATFSASVYDERFNHRIATLDMLGNVQRTVYDRWYRAIADIGTDNTPQSMSGESLWRMDRDTFDRETPNATLSQALRVGGTFDNFRQGEQWREHWAATGNWVAANGALTHGEDTPASLASTLGAQAGCLSVRFILEPMQSVEHAIGIHVGDGLSVQWDKGQWQVTENGEVRASLAQSTLDGRDLWLSLLGSVLLFLVDGRCLFRVRLRSRIDGNARLVSGGKIALRTAILGLAPQTSVAFLDNAKRTVQTQRQQDDGAVVNQTLFDPLGRQAIITRSALISDGLLGYRSAFVESIDWVTGVITGEISQCYPEDDGFPYTRTCFDKTPMSRIHLLGKPGKRYAITDSETQRVTVTRYGTNANGLLLTDLPAGEYPLSVVCDPDKLSVVQYSDKTGRIIASIEGDPHAGVGHYALTRHYFDPAGNCVRTELPNYFDSDVMNKERFIQTMAYDFLGRMVEKKEPDGTGSYRYVYDKANRPRFMQDPNGALAQYLFYWRYDALGRVTEEGCCNVSWQEDIQWAHADEPDWLPAEGLWSTQRIYDGDGSDANAIGKLVTILTKNDDTSQQADVEEHFIYDRRGRTCQKTLRVPAFDDSTRSSGYAYDNLGNRTQVHFPENAEGPSSIEYQYNMAGQLNGILRNGTSLVGYRYNANGALREKTWHPGTQDMLQRTYRYNSPGWLLEIDDAYFNETLTYSEGYDGASYYAGKIASTHNQFKHPIAQADFISDYQYRFAYDVLGRLTVAHNSAQEKYSLGTHSPLDYDANNNITALESGAEDTHYQFVPGSNKLKNTEGGIQGEWGYNANGNVNRASLRGITNILYDRRYQQALTVMTDKTLRYQYDGGRHRVLKTVGAHQTLYLLDLDGQILAQIEKDQGGSVQTEYVCDKQGVLAFFRGCSAYTVLNDHTLSTRLVLCDGEAIAAYNYQPFGSLMGNAWEAKGRPLHYLFTGQEFDIELGLYHFKVRFYDTDVGRFYSIDPAGEFASPYTYAGNDPVYFIDPSGKFSWGSFFAILAGIALVVVGAVLTIATAGAAAPLEIAGITLSATTTAVAGAVVGGALVGAGVSSAAYGASHTSDFNAGSWAAMLGIGAAFGAISGGIGMATASMSSTGLAIAAETAVGAVDGYVSNGLTNVINGHNFNEGGLANAGFGGLFGAVSGVIGRWSSFKNGRLLRSAAAGDPEIGIASVGPFPHHTVVGVENGGHLGWSHLRGDLAGSIGGPSLLVSGTGQTHVYDFPHFNPVGHSSALRVPTAAANQANAIMLGGIGQNHGTYNILTNSCTTWARTVVRAAGLEPPLWAVTPDSLRWWARLSGARQL
ncbi:RHS repeat domain-containing protein [Candidatus Symbiopectobacterium sp. NZEC135]|uniref:RHS repeat domain-containing protein n=1 Tax=Candidatus Symbiopectobacterium sp. NZEC135 TaxID=2820471 RepID=UPI002227F177|nr:RHS repeat-associated core domain-containing protein [Candidatus Symbiopectobacterium sp. NZEC135]MCW2479355.1 RHS repeat-associated core domain-containing protein [Candidatus Symbiopectobacterium sp. NZEC135]